MIWENVSVDAPNSASLDFSELWKASEAACTSLLRSGMSSARPASLLTDLPDSALVSSAHFQWAASDPPKKEIRSRPSSALHPDTAPTSLGKSQSPHRPQALQLHPAPYLSCLILHNAHLALFQQQAPLLFLIRELGPTSEPSPPLSLLPGRPLPRQHQAFLPLLASLSPSPISFRNLNHQHIIPDHLTLHDFSFSLTLTTF